MTGIRLALVTPRYTPVIGGVETHVERLAVHAAARGHQVEVLTQSGAGGAPTVETLDGVVVRRFPIAFPSTHYAVSPHLWRYLRNARGQYDVVHAHNYHSLSTLAAALTNDQDGALIFTPHYHGTSASRVRRVLHRPYRMAGRRIVRESDAVICVSGREAQLFTKDFPAVQGPVHVIPNGVDIEALRSAVPFDEEATVVLSVGRLEDYKQVDRVVAAISHLDEGYVLRVGGEGPARGALEQQISDLGLSERVSLLGRVSDDDLLRWFSTARVFVTASRIEAMPITPLEVLAAGGRVVASDIAAHKEIAQVTNGPVTLLPDEATPAQIAQAIRDAAEADPREAEVSTWEEVGDRTLDVYRVATELRGRSPWVGDS